jgi:hypothetical protein
MSKADIYASLLNASEYADAAMTAMRGGDDAGVRDALEVVRSIAAVVIDQLGGSSSESLGSLH